MKKIFIAVSLLFVIIINSGCPKPCVEENLSFNITSQITPDKDSVHVGDTIYLVSSFPTKLKDQSSGQLVDYSNSTGIGSDISISIIPQGDTIGKGVISEFNYLSINGKIYNDTSIPDAGEFQQLSYEEINDNYVLKIGLMPKQKGNYAFGIGNGLSNGRKKNNSCEKASFNISISNTNQHFYLIEQWIPGDVLSDYGKMHVYYFKVY